MNLDSYIFLYISIIFFLQIIFEFYMTLDSNKFKNCTSYFIVFIKVKKTKNKKLKL